MRRITQSILASIFILISHSAVASDTNGKQLFKMHCSSCHGATGGMDMNKRIAPPIIAVRMHYIGSYTDKLSFVNTVADWVEAPDKNKSLMRGAIRRFNLMPKIAVSRTDVEKIAAYIFDGDIDTPDGFNKHYEERHGKKLGM